MIQLPPYGDAEQQPVYSYTIALDDVLFGFVLLYRERQDRWYMSIYDSDGEPLLLGKKLSVDTPLLEAYEIPGLPPGEIALWDTSGAEVECGFADLGVRCELIYIEVDELPPPAADPDITIEAVP